ncbi:hypothetical protein [Streptomonospora wellingtoniae]|uniref:Uncharacterized protein n=1 Tax=Streptomonospora wellingtoniae TaxID=3075544 RepID=A0ABU2L0I2_9ACTN|nr:hypothetical protein [Streptomonospora sp. DSM 45055]MDT0305072.1 hypothetical protein [Streptomonospora sp. DSM 45055]
MAVATELLRARAAGVRAARQGDALSANPYRPAAATARERMLWRAWLTGYETVRPMRIDYSG